MRYEARRAIFHPTVHVIVREGDFMAVPAKIRVLGPWRMLSRGDTAQLKSDYRLAITRERYALVHAPPEKFVPEGAGTSAAIISLADWRTRRSG
jgi:hypothetical protein